MASTPVAASKEEEEGDRQASLAPLASPQDDDYDPTRTVLRALSASRGGSGKSKSDPAAPVEARHPLQNKWVLWYDPPSRYTSQAAWGKNLKQIVTFDTVEDFWRVFNNVKPASKLASGCDYHLFKEGIKPQWEDPENNAGGKWLASLKGQRETLDKWWTMTLLAVIGETFESEDESVSEEVTGVVVSVRNKGDRLALWTKHAEDEETQRRIGRRLQEVLTLTEEDTPPSLSYQCHDEAMRRGRSFTNTSFYEI